MQNFGRFSQNAAIEEECDIAFAPRVYCFRKHGGTSCAEHLIEPCWKP